MRCVRYPGRMHEGRSSFRRAVAGVAAGGLALLGVALGAAPAAAAPENFLVSNTSDSELVENSLPWAIHEANNNLNPTDTDTITFSLPNPTTLVMTFGVDTITESVSIQGPGRSALTISFPNTAGFTGVLPAVEISVSAMRITSAAVGQHAISVSDAHLVATDLYVQGVAYGIRNSGGSLDVTNVEAANSATGVFWQGGSADDVATLTDVDAHDNDYGASVSAGSGSHGNVVRGDFDDNEFIGLIGRATGSSAVDVDDASAKGNPTNFDFSTEDDAELTGSGNTAEGDAVDATSEIGFEIGATDASSITLTGSTARHHTTGVSVGASLNSTVLFDGATRISENGDPLAGGGVVAGTDGASSIEFDGAWIDFNEGVNGAGISVSAISDFSAVTVRNSIVENNTASDGGGGIWVDTISGGAAQFILRDSTVRGNTALGGSGQGGGGLKVEQLGDGAGGYVTIAGSTIDGNDALGSDGSGGGVFIADTVQAANPSIPSFSLQFSTVSNNTTESAGGGLAFYNSGQPALAEIQSSTISGNEADDDGSQLYYDSDTDEEGDIIEALVIAHSTIVAGAEGAAQAVSLDAEFRFDVRHTIFQSAGGVDLAVDEDPADFDFTSEYNIFSALPPELEAELDGPGVQFETDAKLGPLQNNGGPTETHYLLDGSPAIDTGDPAFVPPPSTDQRGDPRVVKIIDIGAVEVQPTLPATGGELPLAVLAIALLLVAAGTGIRLARR